MCDNAVRAKALGPAKSIGPDDRNRLDTIKRRACKTKVITRDLFQIESCSHPTSYIFVFAQLRAH